VEQGASAAATPREAARGAEVVIAMVRDDEASRFVWTDPDQGALLGMQAGAIALEASTVTPTWIHTLAERAHTVDVHLLDAPVLGSRPQAEAGALISLVGGPAETVERVRGVLLAFASAIHHVGPIGTGARAKLAVNGLFAVQVAALAELFASLPRATAVELLGALPVTSPAIKAVAGLIAAGNYAPQFPIELVAKDLGYLITDAAQLGRRTPMAEAARAVYEHAIAVGFAADNIAGVAQLYFSATT
ncbi:MAG TPA: NAD(P)-dependent oxidoreductase, partial [Enhygromyxa sp.]|nr:NAD(P)-dependent oxidoreductase [Enhygromyxa sp.]